jgi:transposase InsO family protein
VHKSTDSKLRQSSGPPADRGVQYASGVYGGVLRKHGMIPSMSRPADPYDNASCERFMKTLKREEIYANEYRDLDHLRENIAAFIDSYYNRVRLHSALGYRPLIALQQSPPPLRQSGPFWPRRGCLRRKNH